MKPWTQTAVFVAACAVAVVGCKQSEPSAADSEDDNIRYGKTVSERVGIYQEVERAFIQDEREAKEEFGRYDDECEECIAEKNAESKLQIASAHGITVEQLDEIIYEGDHRGWSQF